MCSTPKPSRSSTRRRRVSDSPVFSGNTDTSGGKPDRNNQPRDTEAETRYQRRKKALLDGLQ